jgi:hypothetical protein
MKNTFIIFTFLSMLGCRSERIDLTGTFYVALDNTVMAVLTLKQDESKLTGFFEWDIQGRSRKTVYPITGICIYNSKTKTAVIQITIKRDTETVYAFKGNATDSDSFLGSFATFPAATLKVNKTSWMAIRKK